ncbi:MAG: 1-acyl-sn-glycerol-3-phosphate acyltransferase, partial [Paraglaciecola sp.]
MLAILRIFCVFFYFVAINILLILICIGRPFHRDNVHVAGKL